MSPVRLSLLLLVGSVGLSWAAAGSSPPALVSAVPGFLFVEGERCEVALERAGPAREAVYHFEVHDLDTPWRTQGDGQLPAVRAGEKQHVAFALPLPERGRYQLRVSGKSGQRFSLETTVALTFPPRPPDPSSPWGMFYVPPIWFAPHDPAGADQAAASIRRLGASWVRLNFWANALEPITLSTGPTGSTAVPDLKLWKNYARALHQEGLQILGEISQTPRILSSDPANEQVMGDGGPAYNRTKPANYALWEQLMATVAREFAEEIGVWEIWNEPDNQGVYWRGSPEELVELVRHTAAGLRRGHPPTRIAGCGFTSSPAGRFFAEAALNAGLAKELDVFTFHYSDLRSSEVARWRELLARYRPGLPLWNTEERSPVPIVDREQGVERTFKFLHVAIGYDEYEPLVEKDYTVRPAGLAYSVAARLLGGARYLRTETVAGGSLHLFAEGDALTGVFQAEPLARFLGLGRAATASFELEKGAEKEPLRVTNLRGKTHPEQPGPEAETLRVTSAEPLLFLQGWSALKPRAVSAEQLGRFEAEHGRYGPQWRRVAARDASGEELLETDPWAAEGSSAEVVIDFTAPEEGPFDLLLAAQAAPINGSVDTSFAWTVDGGPPHVQPVLPAPLPGGEAAGVRFLATLPLGRGLHHFRLTPVPPAVKAPAALRLDALVLRPPLPASAGLPSKKG